VDNIDSNIEQKTLHIHQVRYLMCNTLRARNYVDYNSSIAYCVYYTKATRIWHFISYTSQINTFIRKVYQLLSSYKLCLLKVFRRRKFVPAFCYDTLHAGSFCRCKPYSTVFNNNTAGHKRSMIRKKKISRVMETS